MSVKIAEMTYEQRKVWMKEHDPSFFTRLKRTLTRTIPGHSTPTPVRKNENNS